MKNTTEEPNENKTYWNHCFYLNNNSIQQNSNEQQITTSNFEPPWILQYYQDKGYMAISRKDFKLGDVICNEFPITYTKAWHPFNDKEKETIEQEIQSLLKDEQEAFYDMSNAYPNEVPISAGIYMTNSFEMPYPDTNLVNNIDTDNDTDKEYNVKASGMFLAIGRLNHSCIPNAQQTYIPIDKDTIMPGKKFPGYEALYATRHIAIGEEINDCYIELRQTTEERKKELYDLYQFHCTCIACCANNKEDDQRRKRAFQLEEAMYQFISMGELTMAKDIGIELISLLEHPKSSGWGERYIADACVATSEILKELNDKKSNRRYYLEKALQWSLKLTGEYSIETKNIQKKLK